MKRTTLLLLMTTLLVLFGLSACERPAPGSVAPATVAATPPLSATLFAPIGASPTPAFVATVDQNIPLGASPTPAAEATADPNAPLVVEPTAPPAPEPTAEPTQVTAPSGEIIHIVQAGENLFRIGLRYGFTAEELAAYNGIPNPNWISIGQQIRIPPKP